MFAVLPFLGRSRQAPQPQNTLFAPLDGDIVLVRLKPPAPATFVVADGDILMQEPNP